MTDPRMTPTNDAPVTVEREYRKTATIRAVQWWKMGDHPAVIMASDVIGATPEKPLPFCPTLEGGHVVTPGDWIATGVQGEHWPIKPDVFAATYSPVEPVMDFGEAIDPNASHNLRRPRHRLAALASAPAGVEPFDDWIDRLRVEVVQGEYGYEEGEFAIDPDGWRHMWREGLTASEAFARALEAHSSDETAPATAGLTPGQRQCAVCTAIVAEWPEVMCCHCQEMPWKHVASAPAGDGELAAIIACMDQMLADPKLDALAFDKHDSRIIRAALTRPHSAVAPAGDGISKRPHFMAGSTSSDDPDGVMFRIVTLPPHGPGFWVNRHNRNDALATLEAVYDAGVAIALARPRAAVEEQTIPLYTFEEAWEELVNVDDRKSPEEYPDMCLITRDELRTFMEARQYAPALQSPPTKVEG